MAQTDAPMSAATAAAKARYREYRRQQMMKGKNPKDFGDWYKSEYGETKAERRKKHIQEALDQRKK